MEKNKQWLELLDKCKIGRVVSIPHTVFPDEPEPAGGCWMGKLVKTSLGGTQDVGILIEGEPIFTRPRSEVVDWLVNM
jgi:hypothetical protein